MIELFPKDVQDLVGKPHKRDKRGPDEYDCWGICIEVYCRRGVGLPDYSTQDLTHQQIWDLSNGYAKDHADWIEEPEPWCFVFANGHVGLFHSGRVLHSARGIGCVWQRIEEFQMVYPKSRFARWRP